MPLVSTIISTVGRPHLVPRAVRSALAQSLEDIEVITVVDGPDEATREVLRSIHDRRLCIVELPRNVGHGGAVNAGLAAAQAPWIAFLDDDDEWFPDKLEAQLAVAEASSQRYPLVSCRFIARSEAGDVRWPLRLPDPNEPLSEYLFCQRGLRGGEGMLLPSSLLFARALLQEVPYPRGVPMRHDIDWLLRAAEKCEIRPEFVPRSEPLLVWHMEERRARMSRSADWRWAVDWIRRCRPLVTRRAYAGYLLTSASLTAARGRYWRAFWLLLWEAFRRGRPSAVDVGAHLLIWTISKPMRNRIVVALRGRRARLPDGRRRGRA